MLAWSYMHLYFLFLFSDFIQILITKRKPIGAIKFIYEFGLADKFPPPLPSLGAGLQCAKRANGKSAEVQLIPFSLKSVFMEFGFKMTHL